jgi:hypothetical protein
MKFTIALEWDEQSGLSLSKMYPLIDGVIEALKEKDYGTSVYRIGVVMTCMAKDLKQRKRFKKDTKEFTYDILLDYYLIKSVDVEQKKSIIRKQMVEITEQTFSTHKFENFDKNAFLSDFKEILNAVAW